ncbi:MAG: creatininase family protein [Limnochordia bacterium]|jgi:creatinine amidohydrolase
MEYRVKWGYLTSSEIKQCAEANGIVIIPIGSIEQHGPHLPVAADSIIAETVACRTAEGLWRKGIRSVVLPVVWLGNSLHHMDFSGTISLDFHTFAGVIFQVCKSLRKHGFSRIVLLNGHGGNSHPLHVVLAQVNLALGIVALGVDYWNAARGEFAQILDSDSGIGHAGEAETSLMLAIDPELVKPHRMWRGPDVPDPEELASGAMYTFRTFRARTKIGVSGDASQASRSKGERLLNAITQHLVEMLSRESLWEIRL